MQVRVLLEPQALKVAKSLRICIIANPFLYSNTYIGNDYGDKDKRHTLSFEMNRPRTTSKIQSIYTLNIKIDVSALNGHLERQL